MHHVAIMNKSWKLTEKILSGEKSVESRWHVSKRAPWKGVKKGDIIYFKNSGEPVTMRASVARVLFFDNLSPLRVRDILRKYGKADGISRERTPFFYRLFKDKTYCTLIFLRNPSKVTPFLIDKRGFGAMASWISVPDIDTIII